MKVLAAKAFNQLKLNKKYSTPKYFIDTCRALSTMRHIVWIAKQKGDY